MEDCCHDDTKEGNVGNEDGHIDDVDDDNDDDDKGGGGNNHNQQ